MKTQRKRARLSIENDVVTMTRLHDAVQYGHEQATKVWQLEERIKELELENQLLREDVAIYRRLHDDALVEWGKCRLAGDARIKELELERDNACVDLALLKAAIGAK